MESSIRGSLVQDDGNAITDGTYIYSNASVESDIVVKAPQRKTNKLGKRY